MKNFIKFLGIISLVLVIGFSMVACGDDEEGDPTKPGTTDAGKGVVLPAAFTPNSDAYGSVGYFKPVSGTPADGLRFSTVDGKWSYVYIGANSTLEYEVVSIEGNKITVKKFGGSEMVLCTNYTITGPALALVASEGDFAEYASNPMMLVTD